MFDTTLVIFQILIVLMSPFLAVIGFILANVIFQILYKSIIKKRRIPKRGQFNNGNVFINVFYKFPNRVVRDIFEKQDFEFREYGLHMVCGEQGSGKTTNVVFLLKKWKKLYPKMKIATNMDYANQDGVLDHWKQLIGRQNGVYGQVEVIDEIQAWFSSNQSKDFPPEMLTEVSQQRKQRKAIVGTAQVFSRISKPIREQTSFVHLPFTIAGALTIVRVSKPQYWSEDKQTFTKYIRWYYFVHTPDIRNSFDTYKKIDSYKKNGFKSDEVRALQSINN